MGHVLGMREALSSSPSTEGEKKKPGEGKVSGKQGRTCRTRSEETDGKGRRVRQRNIKRHGGQRRQAHRRGSQARLTDQALKGWTEAGRKAGPRRKSPPEPTVVGSTSTLEASKTEGNEHITGSLLKGQGIRPGMCWAERQGTNWMDDPKAQSSGCVQDSRGGGAQGRSRTGQL